MGVGKLNQRSSELDICEIVFAKDSVQKRIENKGHKNACLISHTASIILL